MEKKRRGEASLGGDPMDYDHIYKIIQNNKNVPFIKKIINKKEVTLSHALQTGRWIVYVKPLDLAIKKNNFIESGSEQDALDFIGNYKMYWEPKKPEEMNQEQYEEWRRSPAGRSYTVAIDDGTKYKITVEPK